MRRIVPPAFLILLMLPVAGCVVVSRPATPVVIETAPAPAPVQRY